MIIRDNIKEEWVIYSAYDFMERFKIKDSLENYGSDDDLIRHHLEKDKRKFKVSFGWSKEYQDDCWFVTEIK